MRIQWYGQSAFDLAGRVFIDPFGDVSLLASRGLEFDYPAIEGVAAELVLVTHEHRDHNGVEAIGGSPAVIRSTAGTLESPVGEVMDPSFPVVDDEAGIAEVVRHLQSSPAILVEEYGRIAGILTRHDLLDVPQAN